MLLPHLDAPREMSTTSQFLYKWVLPIRAVQAFRFALETYTQTPMDWAGEHDRNLLLYESARPLAILYEPILRLNQVRKNGHFFLELSDSYKTRFSLHLLVDVYTSRVFCSALPI